MAEADTGKIVAFSRFMETVDEGTLHHDLSETLHEIVAALNDAKQAGTQRPKATITISLKFCLDGQTIEVVGDFKETRPKTLREKTVLWTTPDNHLSTSNPKQMNLGLRDVTGEREVRVVG